MKRFAILLILLLSTTAAAQQLIYVDPQPQPSPPVVVVPQDSPYGLVIVPLPQQQPQTGVITDTQGNRFHFQETGPQSGSYWVYPLQTKD